LKYLILVCDREQIRFDRLVSGSDDQYDYNDDGTINRVRFAIGTVAQQTLNDIVNRLTQIRKLTKETLWPTTLDVYHNRYFTAYPETIESVRAMHQTIRNGLLSMFYSLNFPPLVIANANAEAKDTTAIEARLATLQQDVVSQAAAQKGYYSAVIGQYLGAKGVPTTQLPGLTAVIEQTLSEPLFLTIATSDQEKDVKSLIVGSSDQIGKLLALRVGEWAQQNIPGSNVAEIQTIVANVAKSIQSPASPLSPPPRKAAQSRIKQMEQEGGLRARRPLYSNAGVSRTGSTRSNRDARLRRRARARRTYRVRKQSRKSKTR